jgi:protein translocase SecG subunit
MQAVIQIAQIVVSILIIILVLLQERDSDMSGFLGAGGGGSGFYQQRRGLEKTMFISTIVLVFAFAGLALANLFIR